MVLSSEMNGRVFVLIFFFWAVFTIVTPTLIILSASAKSNSDSNGEESDEMSLRRMMGFLEGEDMVRVLSAPAPAPTPAPETALGHGVVILTKFRHRKTM